MKSRLREIRELNQFTQAQMAEKIGIPMRTYCQYEYGNAEPKARFIEDLTDAFGIDTAIYIMLGIRSEISNKVADPPANYAVLAKKQMDKIFDELTDYQKEEMIKSAQEKARLNRCLMELEEFKKKA